MIMNIPFIDLQFQNESIREELIAEFGNLIDSGTFVLGKRVKGFESAFADFCGTKRAVAVNSGTAALHLSLLALGVGLGDEVITTPFSFFATAEAILLTGAKPVFVDINPQTFTMNISLVKGVITKRTKAIIPVHLYGQTADMASLKEIAQKHDLAILEDSCQAHGAEYNGKMAGSLGDVSAFSFYPTKNLGAFGEGGIITTSNELLANKIELLRAHGERPKNNHTLIGFNHRLEEFQALVLNLKLKHLNEWNKNRRALAAVYNDLLQNTSLITPVEMEKNKHVYHLYVVKLPKNVEREKLRGFLSNTGIGTAVHYPVPIHLQPVFRSLGYRECLFPVSEMVSNQILSLPMYPGLSDDQVHYVCSSIKEAIR